MYIPIYFVWFEDTYSTYIADIFEDPDEAALKVLQMNSDIPHGYAYVEPKQMKVKK